MAPRPYRLGNRQASIDETRARIIAGARDLLMSPDGFTRFTVDAIARQSGVSRMTVYYQFESKAGIYEALADDLAQRGHVRANMEAAFKTPDERKALVRLIGAFVHFWFADRHVMRKLHALSVLDPESKIEQRVGRRRHAIETVLARVQKAHNVPARGQMKRTVEAVNMLTNFASSDLLADAGFSEREAARIVCDMVAAVVGVDLTH